MGAAREARLRKQRSTARHVTWLVGVCQSATAHHTSAATLGAPHPDRAHQDRQAGPAHDILAAQIADLQLQVEALAHGLEGLKAATGFKVIEPPRPDRPVKVEPAHPTGPTGGHAVEQPSVVEQPPAMNVDDVLHAQPGPHQHADVSSTSAHASNGGADDKHELEDTSQADDPSAVLSSGAHLLVPERRAAEGANLQSAVNTSVTSQCPDFVATSSSAPQDLGRADGAHGPNQWPRARRTLGGSRPPPDQGLSWQEALARDMAAAMEAHKRKNAGAG